MAQLIETHVMRAPKTKGGSAKRTKVWMVRWTGPDGRFQQKSFPSDRKGLKAPMSQAEEFRDDMERTEKQLKGMEVPVAPKWRGRASSFAEIAERYLESRMKLGREKSTLTDYKGYLETHLLPWVSNRGKGHDIRLISAHDVRALHDDLVGGVFRSTRQFDRGKAIGIVLQRKLLTCFKKVMKQAANEGIIPDVPGATITIETPNHIVTQQVLNRKHKVFQPRQVYTMLKAADALAANPDPKRSRAWNEGGYRALTYLMCFSGLRISEALAIQFSQIDLKRGIVHVEGRISRYRERGLPKSAKAVRDVDIHKLAIPVLEDYIRRAGLEDAGPSAFLFSTRTGRPLVGSNVHDKCFQPLIRKANELACDPDRADPRLVEIEDILGRAWHGLRRWAVSHAVASGIDRAQIRQHFGHEDDDMVDHYTFALNDLDAA